MELEQNEQVIFERRANRTQGALARGGRLWLTDRRLVFEPHRVENGLSRASSLELPLSEIAGADVAPRSREAFFSGGLRRRLRVREADGSQELFVVGKARQLAALIDKTSSAC